MAFFRDQSQDGCSPNCSKRKEGRGSLQFATSRNKERVSPRTSILAILEWLWQNFLRTSENNPPRTRVLRISWIKKSEVEDTGCDKILTEDGRQLDLRLIAKECHDCVVCRSQQQEEEERKKKGGRTNTRSLN
jgi:hypothetical protein